MKNFPLFFLLLLFIIPTISISAEIHTLEVEFSFTAPNDSARQLLGYRLYKEGVQVCETNDADTSIMACDLQTEDGTFDFTLTAYYADNTESPSSPSFPFTIVTVTPPTPEPPTALFSLSTTTGYAPLYVTFDGTSSTTPNSPIVNYNWTFGDGSQAMGETTSHIFTTAGTYYTQLTVVDSQGLTDTISTPIIVNAVPANEKPIAVITTGVSSPDEPFIVSFDGSQSSDSDGSITEYSWDFGDGTTANGKEALHTYTSDGVYVVSLQVTDDRGDTATTNTEIVCSTPVPDNGAQMRTLVIEFTFTAPENSAKQLLGYRLYKEGEQVCESNNANSSIMDCELLTEDGTFNFTLTAYYSDSSESPPSPSFPFTIGSVTPPNSVPLLAVINPTQVTGLVPFNVSFNGTDSKGDIATYTWNFGDGTSSIGSIANHTYTTSGTYTVTLSVADQAGATSQTSTIITAQPIIIEPEPPTAVLSSSTAAGNAPLNVTFDGSSSIAHNATIVSYNWTFGDGSQVTGETTSHTFTTAGTYYTQLTITDSQGLSDTISTPIIVIGSAPVNEKPVAIIAAIEPSENEPLAFSFDGSQSSDPDGSITQYNWDFGDQTTGSGQVAPHTYSSAGTYTVSLQVTDDRGDSATTSTEVVCETPLLNTINIEVGEVTIDHNWATVAFENTFSHPVVIAGPPTTNGSDPALVRIRNITETGFDVRVQEWDYEDGTHAQETFSYMAIEKGVYTLDNGSKMEAGNFTGTNSFVQVSLQQLYDHTPVILTQSATENETDAVTGRIRNINQYSFEYKLQEMETTATAHIPETIGYIAWEPGKGEISGLLYEIGMTAKSVTHKWFNLNFETEFTDLPFFIAGMQTYVGGDTATVRTQNMSTSATQIKIEEEQSKDSEVNHTKEIIGYFCISAVAE